MIIGFSRGDFYRMFPKDESVALVKKINSWDNDLINAIELNCTSKKLIKYFLKKDIDLSFLDYVSVHGPSLSDKNLKEVLLKLEKINKKYGIDNFVFHAEKGINWDLVKDIITSPISIENMDNRKKIGRTVESIKEIIDKYDFKFTLDLQHAYTNDKSMKLVDKFNRKLGDKIIEYHLSGFDSEFLHYPLFKTKQDEIINGIKKDVPIIIESTFDKEEEAEKELKYVVGKLK